MSSPDVVLNPPNTGPPIAQGEPLRCRDCGGTIFYSNTVHSWVHVNFLKTEDQHQAQPTVAPSQRPLITGNAKVHAIHKAFAHRVADAATDKTIHLLVFTHREEIEGW